MKLVGIINGLSGGLAPASWSTWMAQPRNFRIAGLRSFVVSIQITLDTTTVHVPSFAPVEHGPRFATAGAQGFGLALKWRAGLS
jgi:hypothetical protein